MSTFKVVKVRVRKGKIQRGKKVANKDGYTIRKGRVIRMSFAERRNRKISQKRAARKRKSKMTRALRRRTFSISRLKKVKGK